MNKTPFVIVACLVLSPLIRAEGLSESIDPFIDSLTQQSESWLDSIESPVSATNVIDSLMQNKQQLNITADQSGLVEVANTDVVPLTEEQQARLKAEEDATLLSQLAQSQTLQTSANSVRLAGIVQRLRAGPAANKIQQAASYYSYFHKSKADTLAQVAEFFAVPLGLLAHVNGLQSALDNQFEGSLLIPGGPFSQINSNHFVASTTSFGDLSVQLGLTPVEAIHMGNLSQMLILPRDTHVQLSQAPSFKLTSTKQTALVEAGQSLTSIANSYGLAAVNLIKFNPKISLLIPSRSFIKWSSGQEELFADETLAQLAKRLNVSQQQILMFNEALHNMPLVLQSTYLLPTQSDFPNPMVNAQYQVYEPISFADLQTAIGGTYSNWIESNPHILTYTFGAGAYYSQPGLWYYHDGSDQLLAQLAVGQSVEELADVVGLEAAALTHNGAKEYSLSLNGLSDALQMANASPRVYALLSGAIKPSLAGYKAQRLERDLSDKIGAANWWVRQQTPQFARVEVGPFTSVTEALDICQQIGQATQYCAPIIEMDQHAWQPQQQRQALVLLEVTNGAQVTQHTLVEREQLLEHELVVERIAGNNIEISIKGETSQLPITPLSAAASASADSNLDQEFRAGVNVRQAAQLLLETNQQLEQELAAVSGVSQTALNTESDTYSIAGQLDQQAKRRRLLLRSQQATQNMQDTEVVGIAETPATTATATATVPATAPTSAINTWQDNNYVIQLIAARKLESLKQTFATVDSDKTPVTQFTLTNSGKPMYVLVTGAFTSYSKAKYAVKALPTNALRNNAWIRKVSDIRVDMEDTKWANLW